MTKKMRKGKMFSLDFLISLVAVTAAIGLMIQAVEVNAYTQKEERQFLELKAVAETAGNMLVSNPEIVCTLVDASDNPLGYLNNCLTKLDYTGMGGQWPPRNRNWWDRAVRQDNAKYLASDRLGIPNNYDCLVSIRNGGMGIDDRLVVFDCTADPTKAKNVYSALRQVVVYSENDDSIVPKSELELCISGDPACKLEKGTVTIQVWKP